MVFRKFWWKFQMVCFTVRHNSVLPIIYDVYVIRLHAKLNNRIKYEFFQKLEGEETHEKKYQQQVNNKFKYTTNTWIYRDRKTSRGRKKKMDKINAKDTHIHTAVVSFSQSTALLCWWNNLYQWLERNDIWLLFIKRHWHTC